jgi:23S rRNA (uracil1939-C5)-methyltransferase
VAFRGAGIARPGGCVVFVPGTLPGEIVRARVTRVKPRYAEAALLDVIEPSPDRIAPCCRLAGGSGRPLPGCVYDHAAYPAEVRLKQSQAEEFLRRIPGATAPGWEAPFPSPLPVHYRNKTVLHAQGGSRGGMRLGYVGEDNRTVVDVPRCPLSREPINERLAAIRSGSVRHERPRTGECLTLRWTAADGVVAWPGATSSALPLLTESSPLGPLRVPADAFYQVNPEVADALARRLAEWFTAAGAQGCTLVDLYCGVGLLGLTCAAAGAAALLGIESGRTAVLAARHNAERLGIPASFRCEDASAFLRTGLPGTATAGRTLVILDPPREGMGVEAAAALAAFRPAHIFWVACDPAALARDLRPVLETGYRLRTAAMFDMFPRTAHFETAVWLVPG